MTFFGDSIVYGSWDSEGGWVQRLRKRADAWNLKARPAQFARVFNLGIGGNTSDQLVYRFEAEFSARLRKEYETICVFAVGINDASIVLPSERHRVEPEDFQRHVRTLIERTRFYTSKIAFVGLTPVDEVKTNPRLSSPEEAVRMVDIFFYNRLLQQITAEEGVLYIDVLQDWMAELGDKGWSQDGLHPNAEGHAWMAERIYAGLHQNFSLPF